MEFEMTYKIKMTGQEITLLVDAAGEDCLVSIVFPPSFGDALGDMLSCAWLEITKIEEAAWESYRTRLEEIRDEKA